MTLTELCELYERNIGEAGAECPRCHGLLTEDLGAGRWICWLCGRQFVEGENSEPLVAEKVWAA